VKNLFCVQGDEADCMYFVESGMASIRIRNQVNLVITDNFYLFLYNTNPFLHVTGYVVLGCLVFNFWVMLTFIRLSLRKRIRVHKSSNFLLHNGLTLLLALAIL